MWQLRRASLELIESEALARRAADEDKITGLPNHAKMLELLDLALAERMNGETTTFSRVRRSTGWPTSRRISASSAATN